MTTMSRDENLQDPFECGGRGTHPRAWAAYHCLEARCEKGEAIVMDGATGTELANAGIDPGKHWNGWPAHMFQPKAVESVHRTYVDCGCDIITTNTYATNRHVMRIDPNDSDKAIVDANVTGVKVARQAGAHKDGTMVAGSMSNHPPEICQAGVEDMVFDNESVEKCNPTKLGKWPTLEQELSNYREQAKALAGRGGNSNEGADFLFLEMIKDTFHGDLLVRAAVETGLPVFLGLTLDVVDGDKVVLRDDPTVSVPEILARWGHLDTVVGIFPMHCSAMDMTRMVRSIREAGWQGFLGCSPNQGHFRPPHWNIETPITVDEYRKMASEWFEYVNAVGGCCGVGPDLIRAVAVLAKEITISSLKI